MPDNQVINSICVTINLSVMLNLNLATLKLAVWKILP